MCVFPTVKLTLSKGEEIASVKMRRLFQQNYFSKDEEMNYG